MLTNCKNCGAPLRGLRCEYCGTEYEDRREKDFIVEEIYADDKLIFSTTHEVELKASKLSAYASMADRGILNHGEILDILKKR